MRGNLAATGSTSAPGSADVAGTGKAPPAVAAPTDAVATIATLSMPPSLEALVGAALATWMPRAAVSAMARAKAAAHGEVNWIIVAPSAADGATALAELRLLRTHGYDGPVLLLVDAGVEAGPDEVVELTRLGGRRCALGDGFAERLATLATLATLEAPPDADGDLFSGRGSSWSTDASGDATAYVMGAGGTGVNEPTHGSELTAALHGELAETRRLLALAEVARRLPHALNNPLAALLAEAQLLELEELAPEQREATERIVGLARRVIGLVRELQLALPRK